MGIGRGSSTSEPPLIGRNRCPARGGSNGDGMRKKENPGWGGLGVEGLHAPNQPPNGMEESSSGGGLGG